MSQQQLEIFNILKKARNKFFFVCLKEPKDRRKAKLLETKIQHILSKELGCINASPDQKDHRKNHDRDLWKHPDFPHPQGPGYSSVLINVFNVIRLYSNHYALPIEIVITYMPLNSSSDAKTFVNKYNVFIHKFVCCIQKEFAILMVGEVEAGFASLIAGEGKTMKKRSQGYRLPEAKTTIELLEKDLREYLKRKNVIKTIFRKLKDDQDKVGKIFERLLSFNENLVLYKEDVETLKGFLSFLKHDVHDFYYGDGNTKNKKHEKYWKILNKALENYLGDIGSEKIDKLSIDELLEYIYLLDLCKIIVEEWDGDIGGEFKKRYSKKSFNEDFEKINKIRNKVAHSRGEITDEDIKELREIYEKFEEIMFSTLEQT